MQTSHDEIVTVGAFCELFSATCVWLVNMAIALGRRQGMSARADGLGFQKSASGGQWKHWFLVGAPSLFQ